MGDKAKTPLAMCRLKLVDRIFRSVYCCHRVLLFMRDLVYIVGWVPNTLQNDGCFREFLNFLRKSLHCLLGPAGIFVALPFSFDRAPVSDFGSPDDPHPGSADYKLANRSIGFQASSSGSRTDLSVRVTHGHGNLCCRSTGGKGFQSARGT